MVECLLAKQNVVGSTPTTRSNDKYFMIYIAYRGLFEGVNPQTEDTPDQIGKAFNAGFSVMVDVWRVNDLLYLGADQPLIEVTEKYLQGPRFWINCRNQDMQDWIVTQPTKKYPHYFWNIDPNTPYDTTSDGYLWTYQVQPVNNLSIMVLPEIADRGLLSTVHWKCYGVCTTFAPFIKRIRNEGGSPYGYFY